MTLIEHPDDLRALQQAVTLLEAPALTLQIADVIGKPLTWSLARLPQSLQRKIQQSVRAALHKAVDTALYTLEDNPHHSPSQGLHRVAAAATGAVSGFFGMTGLLVELPISTAIMMRAVADIARSEGFSLADEEVKSACVEVFALGGRDKTLDPTDSGYYASRAILSDITRHASRELMAMVSKKGSTRTVSSRHAASILAKVIDAVATRFGVTLTQKMAAQIIPVIGAASGATINTLFTRHYQNMAKGHFTVKRLELKYGEEEIKTAYQGIKNRTLSLPDA
ncbi:EcsC family protein [Lonsdalea quercina]|uniref:EcsC family protein n=1 Tax=Lonsdalea quercina TaxID=71657 RepID=UPI003974848D